MRLNKEQREYLQDLVAKLPEPVRTPIQEYSFKFPESVYGKTPDMSVLVPEYLTSVQVIKKHLFRYDDVSFWAWTYDLKHPIFPSL